MIGWNTEFAPHCMADTPAAADGGIVATQGLVAGTRVGTAMGWRPVEALARGDKVLTFDNGMQALVDVRREAYWLANVSVADIASVHIPAGAMGNMVDVELLPDQGVLIETEAACDAHGDPFAVVKAKSLDGFRCIRRMPPRTQVEVITLVFAEEQVIYAEGGMLLHCPRTITRLDELGGRQPCYEVMPDQDAAFLVEYMDFEYRGGTTSPDPMAA